MYPDRKTTGHHQARAADAPHVNVVNGDDDDETLWLFLILTKRRGDLTPGDWRRGEGGVAFAGVLILVFIFVLSLVPFFLIVVHVFRTHHPSKCCLPAFVWDLTYWEEIEFIGSKEWL